MLRHIINLAFLGLLLVGAATGIYVYQNQHSVETKLTEEKSKNAELRLVVQRLSTERRVADIVVTEQSRDEAGKLRTALLFVEYGRNGAPLPEKRFVIEGQMAHIDAMVVKFDGEYVQKNDPLRGHSIALFTRLYDDTQSPDHAFPIDAPGRIPDIYRDADPRIAPFESELWNDFWRLADDAAYRQSMGVRIAQGEGVWRPFEPGFLYTITLENNGGLNITSEKLRGIYQALQKTTVHS